MSRINRDKLTSLCLCSVLSLIAASCESPEQDRSTSTTIEDPSTDTSSTKKHTLSDASSSKTLPSSKDMDAALPSSNRDHGLDLDVKRSKVSKEEAPDAKRVEIAEKPKKPKKPKKCRRGINKGKKKCKIERGHITVYHINRGKRQKNLKLIDDKQRIIPEAREVMLDLLGDWRAKKRCKKGFSFNFEYKGRASWRMYDCYVQDRLLWYLYLVGHHFDSEIQIVSGLRSKERKTSRHHNGHAVDFKVAGVDAKKVWEYCKRTFPLTGVGYYPTTRFVHLDVGRDHHQAYWVDSSGSGESASYKRGVSQEQRGRAKKSQAGMIRSIKRSLQRHFKSFSRQQSAYQERKKRREARKRKRRKKRRRKKKK